MSDPIPEDLARALAATEARRGCFGDPLYFFSETGSTNDVAESLAEHGAPEGATVVASTQTAGRGRFGRTWFSPAGAGLYVSVVCRNQAAAPLLTLAGGVAIADGIRAATGLPVQIKWPNDIVVADRGQAGRRKVAGILAEASTGADGLQYVILGFGINLRPAAYPPELADRATSIETELGRPADGALLLAETLALFAASFERLAASDARPVLARWRELAPSSRGAPVEWDTPGGIVAGVSEGIADDGALLVRVGDRVERIISGELRWPETADRHVRIHAEAAEARKDRGEENGRCLPGPFRPTRASRGRISRPPDSRPEAS
jgi:BirA family biotin operon repressor/biotin-[acetyl-CoA-carboxylase] ligase